MSKSIATIVTQPLIVAKVGLQSRPPLARQGKPFKSFIEVMAYITEHEGPLALFKGIVPQITKGVLVQGLLMMTKERCVVFLRPWYMTANLATGWRSSSLFYLQICADLGLLGFSKPPTQRQKRPNKSSRLLLSNEPYISIRCI